MAIATAPYYTLRQLQHFIVLAEELHFGRAAKRLAISQPPLSESLRQLEISLGVKLMERNSRHVRLTPAGAAFLDRVQQALSTLADANDVTRAMAMGTRGILRVGFVPAMMYRGLPAQLQQFQRANPQADLRLMEMNSARQVESLQNRKLDVGFVHALTLPDTFGAYTILNERFVCALPHNHRLAGRRRLRLEECAGERVLVFARDHAMHYHDRIVDLWRTASIEPELVHAINHWWTILSLVSQGFGIALVPQSLMSVGLRDIHFVDVIGRDMTHASQCIWLEDTKTGLIDHFLLHLRHFFESGSLRA